MRLYAPKGSRFRSLVLCVVVFVVLLALAWFALSRTDALRETEQRQILKEAISRAVVSCYAIEGVYPPSLGYLEQYYGIVIDQEKYLVTYEVFADNVRPTVRVQQKGGAR